jgi:hypothetical protein
MDTMTATGWWACSECGVEAELPAPDTLGLMVTCPDCAGEMQEQWYWDSAA